MSEFIDVGELANGLRDMARIYSRDEACGEFEGQAELMTMAARAIEHLDAKWRAVTRHSDAEIERLRAECARLTQDKQPAATPEDTPRSGESA